MTDEVASAHLVLYDGVCGLCQGLVQFVLTHERARTFDFASLQSATGRRLVGAAGGNPDDLTTFYVVANYRVTDARVVSKGRAALFIARALGWPWRTLALFGVLPTALLDAVYDVVARNRYRLFGRRDECFIPQGEYRDRFVD
jgi:predicted DCC family thiol-disulfide oxidoreductase YuxK